MLKKNIVCVVGTRPEAIKMAPVILALKEEAWVNVYVVATAQHRDMLDQVNKVFGIIPDLDMNIMQPNQSLSSLTARLLVDFVPILEQYKPDAVLIQGDTTTVMSVALSCFYHNIPVGHVEAGLRTWDLRYPFPEEGNRVITGKLAKWHFAPTQGSKQNLLKDGVCEDNIFITGNTVIDALLMVASRDTLPVLPTLSEKALVLVTSHRRENFGEPFIQICRAIKCLAENNPNIDFLYPVHPNPNIKNVVSNYLEGISNIILSEPLGYESFIACMKKAHIILTDSGGVQEEAPALGKPVLVLRDETERPEAVEAGVVALVGPHYDKIVEYTQRLLDDEHFYSSMAKNISPYGDGFAARRIVSLLRESLVSVY